MDRIAMDIAGPPALCLNAGAWKSLEVFGEEHYEDGVDKLRRNPGFDCGVGRGRKKHP
jgi:hypothetical protein